MIVYKWAIYFFTLLPLLFTQTVSSAEMDLVATDTLGEHYIDPNQVHYNKKRSEVHFYVVTNEFLSGTQKLKGTSLKTQYVIYCNPTPRNFNRRRMTSFSKLWAKGKVTDSFIITTGDWTVEEPRELLISEYVCEEKRLM
jgi:hypothetical protein